MHAARQPGCPWCFVLGDRFSARKTNSWVIFGIPSKFCSSSVLLSAAGIFYPGWTCLAIFNAFVSFLKRIQRAEIRRHKFQEGFRLDLVVEQIGVMGFDCDRFDDPTSIDRELICTICTGVYNNPVQLPECEHVFCSACIERWLVESPKCPIDRKIISGAKAAPRPAPRIFRTLLSRMRIRCAFHDHNCRDYLTLDQVEQHEQTCQHNPEGLVMCGKGCGSDYKKSEHWEHNCISVLREKLEDAMSVIQHMSVEIGDLKRKVKDLETTRHGPRRNHFPPDVVLSWASQLTLAQVTYWGGLISTPDNFLQNQVREALEASCVNTSCPMELIDALMQNSHERAWPPGLRTLERRLFNRTIYEAYACRRVPGSQAVVILSEDNRHMSDDMILHPGLVVIFAHGVEDSDALNSGGGSHIINIPPPPLNC